MSRIANFDIDFAMRISLAAAPKLWSHDAGGRTEAVVVVLANLLILIS